MPISQQLLNFNSNSEETVLGLENAQDREKLLTKYRNASLAEFIKWIKKSVGSFCIIDCKRKILITSPAYQGIYCDEPNQNFCESIVPLLNNKKNLEKRNLLDEEKFLFELYLSDSSVNGYSISTSFSGIKRIGGG